MADTDHDVWSKFPDDDEWKQRAIMPDKDSALLAMFELVDTDHANGQIGGKYKTLSTRGNIVREVYP